MLCANCGKIIDDNAVVCDGCGSAVIPAAQGTSEVPVAPVAPETPAAFSAPVAPAAPSGVYTIPAEVPVAPAKKGLKKPLIIGGVVAGVVAIVVAAVLLLLFAGNSPESKILKAFHKTVFETSGFGFSIKNGYYGGFNGAISFGDNADSFGCYIADSEGFGYGVAEGVYYDSYGDESEMPEDFFDDIDESAEEIGLDIDSAQAVDSLLNNKIDEEALKTIYNDNREDLAASLEDEFDEEIVLLEYDETQEVIAEFFKKGLTEDAIVIESEKDDDGTVYSYDIDIYEFAECAVNYAEADERFKGILDVFCVMSYIDTDEIIDELDYLEGESLSGEIVINDDGYISRISVVDFYGNKYIIKLFNVNETTVDLDTLKDEIYVDEYYTDDYYGYDEEYGETYYSDAYLMSDVCDLELSVGETASLLLECSGEDVPEDFVLNADCPEGISVEWAEELEDDGLSSYAYVTADDTARGIVTFTLEDSIGNMYDYWEVEVVAE